MYEDDRWPEPTTKVGWDAQRLIDEIEHYNWQQKLEDDPEAKAFHDAIRELVEQKATDNYVARVRARRLARVSEAEKRFGWGDR